MRKLLPLLLFMVGCAGVERGCSSCTASNVGSDWLVVQFSANGKPFNCWKLANVSVGNETQSDGIYWLEGGNLVHISGWYNYVQINDEKWALAAVSLGVNLDACTGGAYVAPILEEEK